MTFQPFANAVVAASGILLVAVGFLCVFRVGKFFHFAHGALFAVAPYLMFVGIRWFGLSSLLSGLLSIGATVLLGLSIEMYCYRPIRSREKSANAMLLCSLGIFVALQACLALVFGSEPKTLRLAPVKEGLLLLGARVTAAQILIVCCGAAVLFVTWVFMRWTRAGKEMEAVANDPDLARTVGIRIEKIYLLAIGLGSGLAAVAGIATSFDVDMTPTMGMQPLMLGVVAVIVGGNTLFGTVLGSLLVGAAQHLGGFWLSSKWQEAIVFGVLVLFLALRPQGMLGKPPRKATI